MRLQLGCFLLVVGLAGPAFGNPAYDFTSAPTTTDTSLTLGFQFVTEGPLSITSLGYYDDGGNGLSTSHIVGIFDAGGTLLVSATVSAGTVDPLVGNFRYINIAPFVIQGGRQFTVAATTGGPSDPWAYGTSATIVGLTVDPSLSIATNAARFDPRADGALHFPTQDFVAGNYKLYAGPDFAFNALPTPEAGSLALMGLGMLGASLLRIFSKANPQE
jgi:hypothetical protein